jgi:hypothetical protein
MREGWPDLSARCRNACSRKAVSGFRVLRVIVNSVWVPRGAAIILWLQSARNAGLLASAYAVELPGNARRGSMSDRCDLIVLGTGVAGAEVAAQAARHGLDVLAIEQRLVGGECPYWGCIPSKAMARAAGVLGEAARAGQLGGKSAVEPDWTIVASGWPRSRSIGTTHEPRIGWNAAPPRCCGAAGRSWAQRRSRSAAAGSPPARA